jgi:hypothetical protein
MESQEIGRGEGRDRSSALGLRRFAGVADGGSASGAFLIRAQEKGAHPKMRPFAVSQGKLLRSAQSKRPAACASMV